MQNAVSLVCPKCHGPLQTEPARGLRCTVCSLQYPLVDGIPSFIIPSNSPRALPGCALTVLILALNEARNLEQVLPAVEAALTSLGVSHEVIVVDAGSTDGTQEVVRKQGSRLVSQKLPGVGGAHRAGFEQARGEYVLTLDADCFHDVSAIADLWAARNEAEVIIASRYVEGGGADMPLWRSVLSRGLNAALRRGLSLPVRDLSSGYRLYKRTALRERDLTATGSEILEEILIRALGAGYRVHEIPFKYSAPRAGQSHTRLLHFAFSWVRSFAAMWLLRNSVASADYEARAFDSLIPSRRFWQRGRHRIITRLANGFEHVLDVGCGSSRILTSLSGVTGLDIELSKLRFARRFGNQLVHGSLFNLPFADGSFDCLVCSEVIEHIPAEEKAFDELSRVLKIGGRLILGTRDYDRWQWRALERIYRPITPGVPVGQPRTHYSMNNLSIYLRGKGFEIDSVEYLGGSEMIFSLRKLPPMASPVPARPIRTALRSGQAA